LGDLSAGLGTARPRINELQSFRFRSIEDFDGLRVRGQWTTGGAATSVRRR
jgi:hypothetical protein